MSPAPVTAQVMKTSRFTLSGMTTFLPNAPTLPEPGGADEARCGAKETVCAIRDPVARRAGLTPPPSPGGRAPLTWD